jgi:enoyl-CoA hydratase/carnithine racemase
MNDALIDGAAGAFEAANADPETRVIVFRGAGRAFCAGDDLTAHEEAPDEADVRALVERLQAVTRAIVLGDKVVVGAIRGWAVGGGFEWAINCDIGIWGEGAKAFFPELEWGLFVTGGVTAMLPAIAGLNRAKAMILLGDRYGAAELKELGLAWSVVPDDQVFDEAAKVAARIATLPVGAVRDFKRAINRSAYGDVEAAMAVETEATIRGSMDPEALERIKGFSS